MEVGLAGGKVEGEVRTRLTAHEPDVFLVFGEFADGQVGVEVFERRKWGIAVREARVG